MRKRLFIIVLGISAVLAAASPFSSFANSTSNEIIMENCGAYLFEWRPVDCGNGRAFAILVGGNTIAESNVILSRERLPEVTDAFISKLIAPKECL